MAAHEAVLASRQRKQVPHKKSQVRQGRAALLDPFSRHAWQSFKLSTDFGFRLGNARYHRGRIGALFLAHLKDMPPLTFAIK